MEMIEHRTKLWIFSYLSKQALSFMIHKIQMAETPFSSLLATALLFILIHQHLPFNGCTAKKSSSASHHHHSRRGHHNSSPFPNPKLEQAFIALQAWKRVIYSDPFNFTKNWIGTAVCSYKGVYCTSALHNPKLQRVAGIDLNFGDLAGFLPEELGLLSDLALLHLSNNRFCGILPQSLTNMTLLYELDLSSNRFVGAFPYVVLSLPSLRFLDIRYNEFEGPLPGQLFSRNLDAIFINNNRFTNVISPNFTGTPPTVLVIANNRIGGCLPPSISKFADGLEELLLINTSISGCLPPEIGYLHKLRVLDVSHNNLVGPIPYSIAGLAHLEVLNLGRNMFTGLVPTGVCSLPNLSNFTFSYNFFCEEEGICQNLTSRGVVIDDRRNCLPEKPLQRSQKACQPVLEHPVDCFEQPCCSDNGGATAIPPALVPAATITPAMAPAATTLFSPSYAPSPTFT